MSAQPTRLAERLANGEFTVAMEVHPPRGFDLTATLDRVRAVVPHLHAVNVADSPRAQGRMSALAACSLLQTGLGVETILHIAIRHRNLLALHSDLLGAHALGARNVFVVLGDKPAGGDYPSATEVSDVTSSGLIRIMADLNAGVGANGAPTEAPASFCIGAALNLNADDMDAELRVLERKVNAGAHFLLTQPVYDPERVERVAQRLGGFPLPVLLGVLPLRTLRHAEFLDATVPGISVPREVHERLRRSPDVRAEGIAISQELLRAARGRIGGAYFMPPFERYAIVQETMSGL
ncbi:MAG: methylenetetrahydrofolate reductase [Chloroflexota bacterium]|nr:methylenetetrahydrofolate reductase [Chloroflexota bacterium]